MPRLFKAACILAASLALASCGAIGFAYNNAPAFVASEFDDAFDLDDAQSARLDTALRQFFAWHRQYELPRYRQLLNDAALAIGDGIGAAEFLQINDAIRAAWQRSLARMIEDVGDLAATLTPRQIEHYQQYYLDESEKYRDYLAMSAQQREIFRVERGLKRLQEWFGDFDDLQLDRVSNRLQQLPELRSTWIRYREARQQALLAELRRASSGELSRQRLAFILLDPASEHARVYETERRAYWQAYAQAIEDISGKLGKPQFEHAIARLHNYAEIIEDLQQAD